MRGAASCQQCEAVLDIICKSYTKSCTFFVLVAWMALDHSVLIVVVGGLDSSMTVSMTSCFVVL